VKSFKAYLTELSAQYTGWASKAKSLTSAASDKSTHDAAAHAHEYAATHAPTDALKRAHLAQAHTHKNYNK